MSGSIRKNSRKSRRQQRGSASVVALILLVVLVVIGVIVGAVALRDHIVQELGDISVGLDSLDQSYSYAIQIDTTGDGVFEYSLEAEYEDPTVEELEDPILGAPADIEFTVLPSDSQEAPVAGPAGTIP